jgi:nucleoside-diphosphate-sugar epimerase
MYIDDCVYGTNMLMESGVAEPLNIGSAELVTINRLVEIVEEIAGVKLKRKYDLTAPQGVRGRNSDNERIRELLGWEPSIPLEQGLTQTYRWIYDRLSSGRAEPALL